MIENASLLSIQGDSGGDSAPTASVISFTIDPTTHALYLAIAGAQNAVRAIISSILLHRIHDAKSNEYGAIIYRGKDKVCTVGVRSHHKYKFTGHFVTSNLYLGVLYCDMFTTASTEPIRYYPVYSPRPLPYLMKEITTESWQLFLSGNAKDRNEFSYPHKLAYDLGLIIDQKLGLPVVWSAIPAILSKAYILTMEKIREKSEFSGGAYIVNGISNGGSLSEEGKSVSIQSFMSNKQIPLHFVRLGFHTVELWGEAVSATLEKR